MKKYKSDIKLDAIMPILNKLDYKDQVEVVEFFMELYETKEEFTGYPDYVEKFFSSDNETFKMKIKVDDIEEELEFKKYEDEVE